MKKILLSSCLLLTGIIIANAEVLLDESFNYTDGALINVVDWETANAKGLWDSDFMIGETALAYSNAGGAFILSEVGKSISCNYLGNYETGAANYRVYRSFSSGAITTGSVYASFLYSPTSAQSQSQAPIISLSSSGSNAGVQVWVGKGSVNTADFRFGTTRGSTTSGDIKWGTTEYSDISAVFLIVLKYDLDTQTSTIYVNPVIASTSEPTAYATDNSSSSNTRTSVQTIQMKVNGASKEVFKISSVRISTTWAEAVAKKTESSINDVISDKGNIVSSRYYNLKGLEVANPESNSGIYIQKNFYSNGTYDVTKIAK